MKIIYSVILLAGCAMQQLSHASTLKEIPSSSILERAIRVRYVNWRGESAIRTIVPLEIFWGKTEWHPHEQWLVRVWDVDRTDYRIYAFTEIKEIGI